MGNSKNGSVDKKAASNKKQRQENRLAAQKATKEENNRQPLNVIIPGLYKQYQRDESRPLGLDDQYELYRRFCEQTLMHLRMASEGEAMLAAELHKIIDDHRRNTYVDDDRTKSLEDYDNAGYRRLDSLYESLNKALCAA